MALDVQKVMLINVKKRLAVLCCQLRHHCKSNYAKELRVNEREGNGHDRHANV